MGNIADNKSGGSQQSKSSHIGFNREVPDDVFWSEQAYVRKLPAEEQREMCMTASVVFLIALVLFLLPLCLWIVAYAFGNEVPFFKSAPWHVCVSGLWGAGILLMVLSQFIIRWIVIYKIRSRKNKLFDPGQGILVSIEDTFTYDKSKLAPEDFGLLKITPEFIMLEMTRHRAQFDRENLSVSLLHTAKNAAGIRLNYNRGSYVWTIVFCPMANKGLISGFAQSAARSRPLLKLFTQMGYQSLTQVAGSSLPGAIPAEIQTPQARTPGTFPVTAEDMEHADVMEKRYQNILAAIDEKINQRKKGWLKNIGILLISLLVFFQLGSFSWGLESVLWIILVIFIHEMGHFLGMKIFGYKNVQMFFIPMFGAAVSGVSCNVAVWKKAIVILLGPLPGILISTVLLVIAAITDKNVYFQAGSMFLFINAFNLLPIVPLDGGRFLQEVLFSRNRYFELVMNILAALLFVVIGFAAKSWIFKILGFLNLSTIRFRFRLASAAQQFQKELQAQKEYGADDSLKSAHEQDIPESILKRMLAWIHHTAPGPMKPKDIAIMVLDIWDRIRIRPPRWGATIALVGLFASGYFVAFISMGVAAVGYFRNFSQKDEIVAYQDPNQATHYKQQQYYMGRLDKEIQLTDDKQYYHGFHKEYDFEKKLVLEGQWNLGRKTGSWKSYDSDTSMIKEVIYEENRQIATKTLKEGKWVEYRWEDYSDEQKEYYAEDANEQYGPGNEYSQNFSQKIKIVAFEDPNHATHYKQQRYFMGRLNDETQLSDDQKYYHGFYKSYYDDGVLSGQGQWDMGRKTGIWRYYDPNTSVWEEIVYEDNKPVLTKMLEDGRWIEYRWDKYSDDEKEYYEEIAAEQYGPGKEPDDY